MNVLVLLFFLHNVLATLLLGGKFVSRKDSVFKNFGIALLLDAAAFAAWSLGILQPDYLLTSVTVGAVLFLISLVFMVRASVGHASPTTQWGATIVSIIAAFVIFYIGHGDPALAYISTEGFFFFNLSPMIQMFYIFALLLAAVPAIDAVASRFTGGYAALVRYGFVAEVAASMMLITSTDASVLYLVGWVIGVVYVALWGTLLFNRKAWAGTN